MPLLIILNEYTIGDKNQKLGLHIAVNARNMAYMRKHVDSYTDKQYTTITFKNGAWICVFETLLEIAKKIRSEPSG